MTIPTVSLGRVFGNVEHSDSIGDLKIWEFEYQKNQKIPQHRHGVAYLCFLICGDTVESDGIGDVRYSRHRLMYIPKGEVHEARIGPDGARFLGCEIDDSRFGAMAEFADLPLSRRAIDDPTLFARILHETKSAREAKNGTSQIWPYEVLAHLISVTSDNETHWIRQVRDYLHDNPTKPFDIQDVCRIAGRHPTHMMRAFRAQTGLTLTEYHRRIRITHACGLVREGKRSLTEISQVCGFADQSHFIKSFRRQFGMTPSAFRRTFRGISH